MTNFNHLKLSWSVSRGRDTYGYNICRLDSRNSGKRYRCNGGGYDMVGTVFGDYLQAEHQDGLKALFERDSKKLEIYANTERKVNPEFYGAFLLKDGTVSLDGACGIDSMIRIANAIGLDVESEANRKGQTIGYFISDKG